MLFNSTKSVRDRPSDRMSVLVTNALTLEVGIVYYGFMVASRITIYLPTYCGEFESPTTALRYCAIWSQLNCMKVRFRFLKTFNYLYLCKMLDYNTCSVQQISLNGYFMRNNMRGVLILLFNHAEWSRYIFRLNFSLASVQHLFAGVCFLVWVGRYLVYLASF